MIVELKPTSDELDNLEVISKNNIGEIYDYKYDLQNTLKYELPFSEQEFAIASQIKQVLEQGGRVLLLTPDSQDPQELTLEQEV